MGEAAAEVEEGLVRVAQAGDEGRVVGGEVDGEVEEEELADAGVRVDVPGFFALVFEGEQRVLAVGDFFLAFGGAGDWTYDCGYVLFYLIWWDLAIVFKEAAGYGINVDQRRVVPGGGGFL